MKGTLNWDRMSDLSWVQDNSAIESIIRKHNIEVSSLLPDHTDISHLGRFWLETCGCHSAVNCLEAIGKADISSVIRKPDILAVFMNDPHNGPKLHGVDSNYDPSVGMGNEYATLYPFSVSSVFGFLPEYRNSGDWQTLVELVSEGHAIQFCTINPGHYKAIVAYDEDNDEFVVVDPWKGNPELVGKNWFEDRLTKGEYETNVRPYFIVY